MKASILRLLESSIELFNLVLNKNFPFFKNILLISLYFGDNLGWGCLSPREHAVKFLTLVRPCLGLFFHICYFLLLFLCLLLPLVSPLLLSSCEEYTPHAWKPRSLQSIPDSTFYLRRFSFLWQEALLSITMIIISSAMNILWTYEK